MQEFAVIRARWKPHTFYQKFEHVVILILSALFAIVVALAVRDQDWREKA
jgi:hypothetical protein